VTRTQRAATVVGSAAVVAAVTVLARAAGFGRSLAFSGAVGSGCVGQAYTTANLLPNVLFEVAAGGTLAGAVIPLVAAARSRADADEQVDALAGGLLGWVLVVLAPASLALALLAGPVSRLLPADTCSGQRELAAGMIAIFAPQVVLYGVGAVLTGVLQAHHRFVAPAVAPLLSSLVVVLAYLGYGRATQGLTDSSDGVHPAALTWLAFGTTLGVLVMTVPLLVPVWRAGIRVRPTLRLPPGVAGQGRRLAAAGTLALVSQQVFVLVTLALADLRGDKPSITVLGYAQTLQLLPYAVLVVPLVTTTYPVLAATAARHDLVAFARLTAVSTRSVIALSTVGAAAVVGVAPAAAAFFAGLDRQRSPGLGPALTALAVGVLGWGLLGHLTRVLYALDAAGRAARAAATGWATGVLAAVVLVVAAGYDQGRSATGLAVAGSVATLSAATALLVTVRRKCGGEATRGMGHTLVVAPVVLVGAGLLGRAAGELVLSRAGAAPGLTTAVVAALAAAVTATALAAAAIWLLDPNALRHLRRPGGSGPHEASTRSAVAGSPSVLLVVATTAGGTGRHVGALAAGMVAAGRRVVIAAPASAWPAMDSGGAPAGLPRVVLPVAERTRPWNDLRTLRRLQAATAQVDVVHAHGLRAAALACLAAAGTPVVATLHNAPPRSGPGALLAAAMQRLVARRAAAVLVVSSDLAPRLRALGARRVQRALIPAPSLRPVDVDHAAALLDEPGLGARRAGVPLLVTVARLAPQKDVDLLLSAVAELGERQVEVLAVVVGDGPQRDRLAARIAAQELPVLLLGHRDDVVEWLSIADVVVVPSRWEGQPLVVQEALRLGAAIVATDAGGTRDVTGQGAMLVPPADPTALADALQALLSDPAAKQNLQVRARDAASRLPDDNAALAQVTNLYDTLVAPADAQGSPVPPGR
jgi:murein biosynthesis integral membrane protein MurJ